MNKIALTGIHTDLLNVSTLTERDYILKDIEFVLNKWDTNPLINYFETSKASIMLSNLPQDLQNAYHQLEQGIVDFIKSSLPSL